MSDFAQRLQEILTERNISQIHLARELRSSPAIVNRWYHGEALPKVTHLLRLCEILEVSSDYLLGRGENHGTKVFSHLGIKWREQQVDHVAINQGIKFFHDLLINGLTVTQIHEKHNIALRDNIRNALKVAFRSGALALTTVPRDRKSEANVAKRYNLSPDSVFVAEIPKHLEGTIVRTELVCFMATRCVLAQAYPPQAIGLGSGYTILRFAEISVPDVKTFVGTKWVPLMSNYGEEIGHLSANHIAQVMANRHPGSSCLFYPYADSDPSEYARTKYGNLINSLADTNEVFVSIKGLRRKGRTEPPEYDERIYTADYDTFSGWNLDVLLDNRKDEFGFEFLGMFFDKDGNRMEIPEHLSKTDVLNYTYQVTESQIKNIVNKGRVWLIAAREYKAEPTRLALKEGLVNALVIDSEIADYLIEYKS